MVRSLAQRGLPKPFAILVAALLALYFVPLGAMTAHAAVPGFEIDGNLADDATAGIDWQTLNDAHDPALLVRNDNGGPNGDTSVFSTSSKENDVVAGENTPGQWTKGSPNTAPPKTDIGNYYKYIRTGDDGHIELFFGWDRLAPSGTDYYYLELNKLGNTTSGTPGTSTYFSVPTRSAGDIRFTLHELGNGDLVILAVDKWDGTKWTSQALDVSGFDGQVNNTDISPAGFVSPAISKNGPSKGTIPADQFFETTFDLTTLIGFEAGCPPAFGTLNFRTATGESAQATGDNLKDYLEPIALGAPSTCGSLSIIKQDDQGAALGGATFKIHPNPLPDGVPGSELADLIIFDDSDANTAVEAGTNYDDPTAAAGSIVLDQVEPGTYEVTEVTAPAGYDKDSDVESLEVPSKGSDSATFVDPRQKFTLIVRKVAAADPNVHIAGAVFDLYKETTGNSQLDLGAGGDTKVGTCTTASNGECSVGSLAWGEKYYWYEVSVPAPYNLPSNRVAGPITVNSDGTTSPTGTTVFADPQSKIVTHAAPKGQLPNATISDTATLSGLNSHATGTVTFDLYYTGVGTVPNADSCTEGALVQAGIAATQSVAQVGNGDYTTGAVSVSGPGYYAWVAHYSGDTNGNRAVSGACGDEGETSWVQPQTSISTVATASAVIKAGEKITDSAQVTGLLPGAGGTVTFALYGPGDTTCAGPAVFTSANRALGVVSTQADGTQTASATSESYAPTAAGTYRWVASYTGDAGNNAVAGACNDPNEQSVVKAGDQPGLDKFSDPASGTTVQPGTTIHYSVKVSNTGDVAITNADVLDVLPPYLTVVTSTISDGGAISADKSQIAWKVTLQPGGSHTFTFDAKVNADAPQGAVLVNTAKFLGLQDTTSHTVPSGALGIHKTVTPVAGGGTVVEFGDTLTYTLTINATGALTQPNVVVTDILPGKDPAHPRSGKTTYVAGSAKCLGLGACTVTGPDASGKITWALGDMLGGSSRQVTFKVSIDDVSGQPGQVVAVDIDNGGAVTSSRSATIKSNVVTTPVSKVLPVKIPRELPHTGATLPVGLTVGGAALLLGLGLLLLVGSRRRGLRRQG